MLVVFPMFAMIMAGGALLLLLPAIVDLVRRDDDLPLWSWGLPFVLLLGLPVLGTMVVPVLERRPYDQAMAAAVGWIFVHLVAAFILLVLALGLAASRGLRPEGSTRRRRRTTIAAVLALIVLQLVPWLPGQLALLWLCPAGWAAVLWVVAMNRRGPARLERGKRASAAFLVASAVQLLIGLLHIRWFGTMEEPSLAVELQGTAWLAAGALAVMVTGLRYLAGGVPPTVPLLSLATGLTLLLPPLWFSTQAVPTTRLPVWEDLRGHPGGFLPTVRDADCILVPGTRFEGCSYRRLVGLEPETPLDTKALVEGDELLVDDGRHYLQSWGFWSEPLRVEAVVGGVKLEGDPRVYPVDAALHEVLATRGEDRKLEVRRTPLLTVQQFVSMCASTGLQPSCEVVGLPLGQ
ncbi:MAG: hypothetical protein H6736_18590 [Alphaproteobacteria bacterium]|nr:hypothetical protein [Alphaproteobacteria bacterium]MCB9693825.1 hypothetical protein [Alphaproteobacteria bacterium]